MVILILIFKINDNLFKTSFQGNFKSWVLFPLEYGNSWSRLFFALLKLAKDKGVYVSLLYIYTLWSQGFFSFLNFGSTDMWSICGRNLIKFVELNFKGLVYLHLRYLNIIKKKSWLSYSNFEIDLAQYPVKGKTYALPQCIDINIQKEKKCNWWKILSFTWSCASESCSRKL